MTKTVSDHDGRVRLQKFLSDAGVASRRRAEELIREGRVLVNNLPVTELPAFVRPGADQVICNGAPVKFERNEYYLVHKPKGFVCTNFDPAGRRRAIDLLPPNVARLFPVGRLDINTTGLLLMTNDGELAERITHPRFGVPKVYRAEVRGKVRRDLPARLKEGVYLSDGKAIASEVRIIHSATDRSMLEITLREGKNRQVRRMLARCDHKVTRLTRIKIGTLSMKNLPLGGARRLTGKELQALRDELARGKPRRQRRPSRPVARNAKPVARSDKPNSKPAARSNKPHSKPAAKRKHSTPAALRSRRKTVLS